MSDVSDTVNSDLIETESTYSEQFAERDYVIAVLGLNAHLANDAAQVVDLFAQMLMRLDASRFGLRAGHRLSVTEAAIVRY